MVINKLILGTESWYKVTCHHCKKQTTFSETYPDADENRFCNECLPYIKKTTKIEIT